MEGWGPGPERVFEWTEPTSDERGGRHESAVRTVLVPLRAPRDGGAGTARFLRMSVRATQFACQSWFDMSL